MLLKDFETQVAGLRFETIEKLLPRCETRCPIKNWFLLLATLAVKTFTRYVCGGVRYSGQFFVQHLCCDKIARQVAGKPWLKMITQVTGVLRKTVVGGPLTNLSLDPGTDSWSDRIPDRIFAFGAELLFWEKAVQTMTQVNRIFFVFKLYAGRRAHSTTNFPFFLLTYKPLTPI